MYNISIRLKVSTILAAKVGSLRTGAVSLVCSEEKSYKIDPLEGVLSD